MLVVVKLDWQPYRTCDPFRVDRQIKLISLLSVDAESAAAQDAGLLLCPKRPKWKYYMLKKEVEKVRKTCMQESRRPLTLLNGILITF